MIRRKMTKLYQVFRVLGDFFIGGGPFLISIQPLKKYHEGDGWILCGRHYQSRRRQVQRRATVFYLKVDIPHNGSTPLYVFELTTDCCRLYYWWPLRIKPIFLCVVLFLKGLWSMSTWTGILTFLFLFCCQPHRECFIARGRIKGQSNRASTQVLTPKENDSNTHTGAQEKSLLLLSLLQSQHHYSNHSPFRPHCRIPISNLIYTTPIQVHSRLLWHLIVTIIVFTPTMTEFFFSFLLKLK